MRVGVHVLLHIESLTFRLQLDGYVYVYRLVICFVFIVLDITTRKLSYLVREFSLTIDQGERPYAMLASNFHIIGTKRRSDVYNARTIFGGYKIARDYAKSISFCRLCIRQQLLVAKPRQATAGERR